MRLIKMGDFTRAREETNTVIIQEIHKARAKTKTHGGIYKQKFKDGSSRV